MQTLTIKINDKQNVEFLIELLSKFTFIEEIKTSTKRLKTYVSEDVMPIRKATGKPSINDFAGMWQHNPKTLEQIREKAWKRSL